MHFITESGSFETSIDQLTIAGWTGRDATMVQHHIDELAAIGVTPPSRVPLFYRAAANLLTFEPAIEVLGDATSGEAEPISPRAQAASRATFQPSWRSASVSTGIAASASGPNSPSVFAATLL